MFEYFLIFLFGLYCKVISYKYFEICKYDLIIVNVFFVCLYVFCCFNNLKKNIFRI